MTQTTAKTSQQSTMHAVFLQALGSLTVIETEKLHSYFTNGKTLYTCNGVH